MTERFKAKLISGGHKGTEAEFGRNAERWGLSELTLSYEGHRMERSKNVEVLDDAALAQGDVSMEIVFAKLGRRFARGKGIRRVIQSMFHLVKRGDHLFAVGWIQPDDTVKGGTGWGVELAKFFNRHLSVFDQEKEAWFDWNGQSWEPSEPIIPDRTFSATGTRTLTPAGAAAIEALFQRSFGSPD